MKCLVGLIVLLFFASPQTRPQEGGAHEAAVTAETICITSDFSVEIDYPNFFVSILAHLTGSHVESLTLVEWDIRTPVLSSFLLHLSEGETRWLEIASDSLYPSFVKLPRADRAAISPGALSFLKSLIQFFHAPRTDSLQAVFEYGGDTLRALASQISASVDSSFHLTTVSRVETWNRDTGEAYISGEVRALTHEGYTSYPDIRISLKHKDIRMRFTALHVSVARSTP